MNIMMHPKQSESLSGGHYASREREHPSITTPETPILVQVRKRRKPARSILWYRLLRELALLALAVAVPTGLGLASGLWIDTLWPSSFSWLLILTPVGLLLGAGFAVFWWEFS